MPRPKFGGKVVMKIIVIGGSGLIGSRVVTILKEHGHEAIAASPKSGVNTVTGEGLAEALSGASVVVDVSNSPSWEAAAVLAFFETSTRNLLEAEANAGVGHHVALSVVGSERLLDSGYFPAKIAQENLLKESSIAVASVAEGPPLNGTIDVAGPEAFPLDELIRIDLAARSDPRPVVTDPNALYFGAKLNERTLVPHGEARLGATRFKDWLDRSLSASDLRDSDSRAKSTNP